MGYRLESYSLNELHRISIPGAVVAPSLFWVLPVGKWHSNELVRYWQHFTDHQSFCWSHGLLLLKDQNNKNSDTAVSISLENLQAQLNEVLPFGTEQYSSSINDNIQGLLVLSGGYPQPGWGVLIEGCYKARDFESLLIYIKEDLSREAIYAKAFDILADATQAFHDFHDFEKQRPPGPHFTDLDSKISAAEKIDNLLQDITTAIDKDKTLPSDKIAALLPSISQSPLSKEFPDKTIEHLNLDQKVFANANALICISVDDFRHHIWPHIDEVVSDNHKRGSVFASLQNEEQKLALKACIYALEKNKCSNKDLLLKWAQETVSPLINRISAHISELKIISSDVLARLHAEKNSNERKYKQLNEIYRERMKLHRESFHSTLADAIQSQWDIGPKFLVKLEEYCRDSHIKVSSISWDPARMVGWKIVCQNSLLNVFDLQCEANQLAPDVPINISGNAESNEAVDGSFFTDYVHHVAMSSPGSSAWKVTRDLVAKLLRPTELSSLIKSYGGTAPQTTDRNSLASQVIELFGWHQPVIDKEISLASCIEELPTDGKLSMKSGLTGNDLRIILESFCKDIMDTTVAQSGYSHDRIWDAIEERAPGYRPYSKKKDWNEEISHLMLGGATILLPVFAPLAFPNKSLEIGQLTTSIDSISKMLNSAIHHKSDQLSSSHDFDQIPSLISDILATSRSIFGDCPWHLYATHSYGTQPKVLSGEAWSHSSKTPRQLKVIFWTGADPGTSNGQQILFWNKSGKNPVVPDPVLIRRPSLENIM